MESMPPSAKARFFGVRATVLPKQRGTKTRRPALLDRQSSKAPYMVVKWASSGNFNGIDPRKKGLKGIVLGLFLQTKGVFEEQKLGSQAGLQNGGGKTFITK